MQSKKKQKKYIRRNKYKLYFYVSTCAFILVSLALLLSLNKTKNEAPSKTEPTFDLTYDIDTLQKQNYIDSLDEAPPESVRINEVKYTLIPSTGPDTGGRYFSAEINNTSEDWTIYYLEMELVAYNDGVQFYKDTSALGDIDPTMKDNGIHDIALNPLRPGTKSLMLFDITSDERKGFPEAPWTFSTNLIRVKGSESVGTILQPHPSE